MRSLIQIFVGILLLTSCTKERSTAITAVLFNNTTHKIVILPYKNGVVLPEDTIFLSPNAKFTFAQGSEKGDITGPGFNTKYLGNPSDPFWIIYDDSIKIIHCNYQTSVDSTLKFYSFNSNRNILNVSNYEFTRVKEKNGNYTNNHNFTFTEQDYIDAKE